MRRPVRRRRYPVRRNTDEERRQLERAAATGDHRARVELWQHNVRDAGGMLQWLALADVREIQAMVPIELLRDLSDNVLIARHTTPDIAGGGWFPDHMPQNVCPRGHEVDVYGFDYTEVKLVWTRIHEADETTAYVGDRHDESDQADAEWITCRKCYSSWPSQSVEYE